MSDINNREDIFPNELNFMDIFNFFWNSKIIILLFSITFAFLSVIYSLSLKNYYKSDAILYVQDVSQSRGGLSNISNLASLAGISINSSGEKKDLLAINTMNSRVLLKTLLNFDYVLPSLMAAKSFDKKTNQLRFDEDFKPGYVPDFSEIYEEYRKIFNVSQDRKTGLIYLSVEHLSPVFSKKFLDLIINQTNFSLQSRDLVRSTNAINYLKNEYKQSNILEIRERISNLIEAHLETQMTSKIDNEYILKTIDPPYLPDKKSKPSRATICIAGTFLGAFLGMIYALILNFVKLRKSL